ncbi:MAG: methyltransferase [Pseudomonadota bacterium]
MLAWRDRLLTSPEFQRRSMHFPIARGIARRRMRALFDLCGGFIYSQVLLACTRLKVFERVADAPQSAAQLAEALAVPVDSMQRLLDAAQSLQLLEHRGNHAFGLGPLGAALIGNPSVGMMIEHHQALYADLNDPIALMRGESSSRGLAKYWAYSKHAQPSSLGADDTRAYSELMAASQIMIADQVLTAYPMRRHRRLIDIGGGAGAFTLAAMQAQRQLHACVFDLPAVCDHALVRFEQAGVSDRGSVHGGDFTRDPLPTGFDLLSFVRVLHDHDDKVVIALLRAARAAMDDDATLLIAEPLLGTPGAEPVGAAYFGFYLMAMGQGRPRSAKMLKDMLTEAGFMQVREHRTYAPLLVRVLTAKPGPTG